MPTRPKTGLLLFFSGGPSDTTRPTCVITCAQTGPTAVTPLNFTFTFSETVTGFTLGDITAGGGTAGNFAGSGAVYTADITPDQSSAVTADVAEGVCTDAAGNTNEAATQLKVSVYGAIQSTTLQPDATAGFDTQIVKEAPTNNYNTSVDMYIGTVNISGAIRGLIKFDLSSLASDVLITSATLHLYEDSASDAAGVGAHAVALHRVLRNWVEAQATWNIYSTGNNWGTAGAGNDTDRTAAASATLSLDGTSANAYVQWTGLAADVQAMLAANNFGWLVQALTAEELGAQCFNKFKTSDEVLAKRPKLEVGYRVPLS
jgi:hypothetical protein